LTLENVFVSLSCVNVRGDNDESGKLKKEEILNVSAHQSTRENQKSGRRMTHGNDNVEQDS
jgi:hypothetical protein